MVPDKLDGGKLAENRSFYLEMLAGEIARAIRAGRVGPRHRRRLHQVANGLLRKAENGSGVIYLKRPRKIPDKFSYICELIARSVLPREEVKSRLEPELEKCGVLPLGGRGRDRDEIFHR